MSSQQATKDSVVLDQSQLWTVANMAIAAVQAEWTSDMKASSEVATVSTEVAKASTEVATSKASTEVSTSKTSRSADITTRSMQRKRLRTILRPTVPSKVCNVEIIKKIIDEAVTTVTNDHTLDCAMERFVASFKKAAQDACDLHFSEEDSHTSQFTGSTSHSMPKKRLKKSSIM